ncbi:TRAP transporter substrate-binding protein [Halomonas sp. HL-93]|uniref:TRAP transporter substrate-binding protein n=1 Tax=Halomonas sp. HL-93 TaxID=1666906 RepID=UPI0006D9FA95|nr:TRAP transporter substrate-binding protein [Halomonas sp. HL-93]KPQ21523.1 MAG: TRAP-type uptake system substrate-binding component [Halomonas sp. HL-93]SBR52106.1 tripartite ATP-independent transporter solute receptor, DctP family [Halomonas sp. HL-93]
MQMRFKTLATGSLMTLLTATPAMAQEHTMILAHGLSDKSHPLYQTFEKIADDIESNSDGRIDVQHQSGGALGGDRELMESLLLGDIQFVPVSTSGAVQFIPEFAVFEIPYIFPTQSEPLQTILNDSEFTDRMKTILTDQGLKLGGFYNGGFRQLTTSNTPVRTLEDIRDNDLRIRVPENPYSVAIWEALGAAPTPISFPELYGALQQGVVDGQENPYGHILSQRFYEVQNYLTTTNHIFLANVNLLNKQWFDSLPDDLQQVVDDALAEAETFQWDLQNKMLSQQRTKLEESMEFIDLDTDELEAFREATAPIEDQVREDIGDDIVDSLMTSIENTTN